ncbi:MAG: alpha-(1-_3)-arabinofuranosyltransferase domain-containing protein, partial [Microthrixaceae bacterium]
MTDTPSPRATSEPPRKGDLDKWLGGLRIPALGSLLLGAVAYIPLLLTAPGEVGADTKTYLYLDPSRLLGRAVSMWDTNIGLGTVTHQNIGYLWPMGPWYWLFDTIGVPDWIAQRLWLGTIIFAAGMGVRFMLRELRWVGPGLTVASFAYALSPYLLHYGARISVILLPFAGLPWLIGIAARCVRRGGWRWPAVFALVTLTVGGVNATSLVLVMAGPILWMAHAAWVSREATFRTVFAAGVRITLLTGITSLWWIAGLAVQGAYGIPILRYTETYYTVANAALSTELLRGLGYWFFYGRDALGAWIAPAERLVQSTWALVISFVVPLASLSAGFLTRFANRGYFALLVATGMVIGVGAHPWESLTPVGAAFKAWTETDSGLAFRSTPRAVPLIALGLAVMLAAGLAAVANRWPGWRIPLSGVLLVLICANQFALFAGELVDRNLKRDEQLPEYWLEAAEAIDSASADGDLADTRVYELPGTDFASYRWGNTVDPITPGLIDRPYVARELIPYGTAPSADLLNALDVPLQEGSDDPAALTPIAQLMGVGTIAHRGDLQFERFRSPRPDATYRMLTEAPGISEVATFGDGVANEASDELPLDDEVRLGMAPGVPGAPAVSLFDLEDPRDIARTVSASTPTILSGDGAGVVAWGRTGGLDPDRALFYSASFAQDPDALDDLIATEGSQLVVTDTNRRQGRRWGSVRENDGYTERAGEEPLDPDPADNRLEKFPGAGDDAFTVSEQRGGATLSASAYGNPVSYTPADRAAKAMDGDPATAWRVGAFDEPRGEFLEVELDEPITVSELNLLQRQPPADRWITEVELLFDDDEQLRVPLGEESLVEPGQLIEFGSRT